MACIDALQLPYFLTRKFNLKAFTADIKAKTVYPNLSIFDES